MERGATEHNNIAIGSQAMGGNYGQSATGSTNIAIGNDALRYGAQANGGSNIAIGNKALEGSNGNSSAANYNIAIGIESIQANTTGDYNIGLGYKSLEANTTGLRNISIGAHALDAADTENDNIAIGYDALGGAIAGGEKNLAIGNYAGDAVTSGDNNTLIGYNSGGLINTGGSNILIGAYSGDNITTGTGNVQIGRRDVASATGDNQLSISSGGVVNIGWIEGNDIGGVMTKAGIVAISSNTTLDSVTGGDPAQSGSYVYWTAGTLTLPYNATVGTQYVIINCTGADATPGLNSNGTIVNGSHSAMSDDAARTYVCVSALNAQGGAPNWVMIG